MKHRKRPLNLLPLLAVPLIGTLAFGIRQLIRRWRRPEPLAKTEPQPVGELQKPALAESSLQRQQESNRLDELRQPVSVISAPAFYILLVPFLIIIAGAIVLAFYHLPVQSQSIVPGGDVKRGQAALQSWGCGSCHTIRGVTGANGKVGPELKGLADRSFIAGRLQNTPDNMILWIMHPQQVSPGVDMIDTGVPENIARDMAAYLYTLR